YHPGRAGALCLGDKALAHFGELHPRIARHFGLKSRVVIAEIYPTLAPMSRKRTAKHKKLVVSALQPLYRDFAFLCESSIKAQDLVRAIRGVDKTLISAVELFDVYASGDLGDKVSLAIRVTLQPYDTTLQEEQIDDITNLIITAAKDRVGALLRT
ncbi:MAG: phenylalanine--tRNA ligase subunit beta, partial [Pseudomonadota bacterium]